MFVTAPVVVILVVICGVSAAIGSTGLNKSGQDVIFVTGFLCKMQIGRRHLSKVYFELSRLEIDFSDIPSRFLHKSSIFPESWLRLLVLFSGQALFYGSSGSMVGPGSIDPSSNPPRWLRTLNQSKKIMFLINVYKILVFRVSY